MAIGDDVYRAHQFERLRAKPSGAERLVATYMGIS